MEKIATKAVKFEIEIGDNGWMWKAINWAGETIKGSAPQGYETPDKAWLQAWRWHITHKA